MMWALYIAIAILVLFLIISVTKLNVTIEFKHAEGDEYFRVTLKAWFNLIKYTIDVPLIKVDEEQKAVVMKQEQGTGGKDSPPRKKKNRKITPKEIIRQIKNVRDLLNHVVGFHRIIKKFFSYITVSEIKWNTTFGAGDAAHTGMLSGALWSAKGSIIGLISHYMRLKTDPELVIDPRFQQFIVATHLKCMISFRIGHAIGAVFRILKYWKRHFKGGRQHVRTSNPGLNDNSYGKFEAND